MIKTLMRLTFLALLIVVFHMIETVDARAGTVTSEVPTVPDPQMRYIFYMHGGAVEERGDGAYNERYRRSYRYHDILETLAAKGFHVIGEVRPRGTKPPAYARKVAEDVERLRAAGVPADRITVAGHSKGGAITLHVAAILSDPGITYIPAAGCGRTGSAFEKSFRRFLKRAGDRVGGRVRSLYDADDRDAGTCAALDRRNTTLDFKELKLETGEGHGLFYEPSDAWIDIVVRLAQGGEF